MKKFYFVFFLVFLVRYACAQSINDLERDPSFKGITIGAPISKYSDILKFGKTTDLGENIYAITDKQYYSIFGIKVDEANIIEKDGIITTVFLAKTYSSTNFNLDDVIALESNLTPKYGAPNVDLTNFQAQPAAVAGRRWQAKTVAIDIVYIYYNYYKNPENPKPGLRYILRQKKDDY